MAKKSESSKKRKSTSKAKSKTTSKSKSKKETKKKSSLKWYSAILGIVALIVGIILENNGIHLGESDNTVAEGELFVHYIDVGQGDCIFIESESKNMLIDCGESSESDIVISYLQEQNVSKIDYLVGTHPHSDHMGGMSVIVDTFEIGTFIMPYLPDDDIPTTKYFERLLVSLDENGVEITNAEVGEKINLGDSVADIIAPVSSEYSNTNNYSIGIILEHGENSFIFTGDAEDDAEEEMINNYASNLRDIDVYKAGHHGSSTSSSDEFMAVIQPEYAVIMCGEGNSYGHPNDDAMERISEYVADENIYRTDLYGTVVAESDGSTINFTTEK